MSCAGASSCECPGIVGGRKPPYAGRFCVPAVIRERSIACAIAVRTRTSSNGGRAGKARCCNPGSTIGMIVVSLTPSRCGGSGWARKSKRPTRHASSASWGSIMSIVSSRDVAQRTVPLRVPRKDSALFAGIGDEERPVGDGALRLVPSRSERLHFVPRPGVERRLGKQVQHVRSRFGKRSSSVTSSVARASTSSSMKAVVTSCSRIAW